DMQIALAPSASVRSQAKAALSSRAETASNASLSRGSSMRRLASRPRKAACSGVSATQGSPCSRYVRGYRGCLGFPLQCRGYDVHDGFQHHLVLVVAVVELELLRLCALLQQ